MLQMYLSPIDHRTAENSLHSFHSRFAVHNMWPRRGADSAGTPPRWWTTSSARMGGSSLEAAQIQSHSWWKFCSRSIDLQCTWNAWYTTWVSSVVRVTSLALCWTLFNQQCSLPRHQSGKLEHKQFWHERLKSWFGNLVLPMFTGQENKDAGVARLEPCSKFTWPSPHVAAWNGML